MTWLYAVSKAFYAISAWEEYVDIATCAFGSRTPACAALEIAIIWPANAEGTLRQGPRTRSQFRPISSAGSRGEDVPCLALVAPD